MSDDKQRRVPPKRRGNHPRRDRARAGDQPDTRSYSAPSHLGGQFEDAGYGRVSGQFGFTPIYDRKK